MTRRRVGILWLWLLGGAAVSPPVAAAQDQAGARAVADSFIAAANAERWDVAAALLDPMEFEQYFRARVAAARDAVPPPMPTVEDLMARDTTLPRAVAEWQVAQAKKARVQDPFADVADDFAGVTSFEQLEALSLPEAAARWLEAQDGRWRMRDELRRQGCPAAGVDSLFPYAARSVLAVAMANDSTAYALYSNDVVPDNQDVATEPAVLRLVRWAGAWRILPSATLLQRADVMVDVSCRDGH